MVPPSRYTDFARSLPFWATRRLERTKQRPIQIPLKHQRYCTMQRKRKDVCCFSEKPHFKYVTEFWILFSKNLFALRGNIFSYDNEIAASSKPSVLYDFCQQNFWVLLELFVAYTNNEASLHRSKWSVQFFEKIPFENTAFWSLIDYLKSKKYSWIPKYS